MSQPITVVLDKQLETLQAKWINETDRAQQDEIFSREFGPLFASRFAELPLFGAPEDFVRPTSLVSVLGLSYQPVALMAAWIRPQRMLVLGTTESFKKAPSAPESPLARIARLSGMRLEDIEHFVLPDPGEVEIYQQVREFIARHALDPRTVAVDPTGGKKSMSASASLAGFLFGTPLVYVDYLEYHNRIPKAGTEYPRLLTNPLDVLGDLEMNRIRDAFNRGDFSEAEHLAVQLAQRLYEPRGAELMAKIAQGYGAWSRFHFEDAQAILAGAMNHLRRHGRQGKWRWADGLALRLQQHLPILEQFGAVSEKPTAFEQGLPLIINHLAAAYRATAEQRYSIAIMLAYSTIERYVDLCLWVDLGQDTGAPDYDKIKNCLQPHEGRYHSLGRKLFGKGYAPRPLDGYLMYANGLQLLATLCPHRIDEADLGPLQGLGQDRNKTEYEHGLNAKLFDRKVTLKHLDLVKRVIGRSINRGEKELDEQLAAFSFPQLT